MKNKYTIAIIILLVALGAGAFLVTAQQPGEIRGNIVKGEKPKIAVPDFRGSGDAQRVMDPFNQTLWDELAGSGVLNMVAKSLYPLSVPQRPQDFHPPTTVAPLRRGDPPRVQSNGPWLTDWAAPPVNANYLAFGYTASQNGQLVLYGVAAAVIGGTSLFGGRGKMVHALVGGLVIGVIYNGLALIQTSPSVEFMATGLVLVAAIGIDSIARRGAAAVNR